MLSFGLLSTSNVSSSASGLEIVETEYPIDINDRELGGVTVEAELLGTAPEHDLVLKLNVGESVFVDLAAVPADDEGVGAGSDTADHVVARDLRLLPLLGVVDLVRVRDLLDVERVLFAALFLLFLLKGSQLRVLRSVLPVVHHIVTGHDYVRLVHRYVFGLNSDVLIFNGTTDSIAKNNDPLIGRLFSFRH
jgi:hypothetical protein